MTTRLVLHVDGMTCRHCVRQVTSRVRDVAGVTTVSADTARCELVVEGSVDQGLVLDAVTAAGHTARPDNRLVDLSHTIVAGMTTHPGLPLPATALDSSFHRLPDGTDLAGLPLDAVADLPVVVVEARGERVVTPALLPDGDLAGHAVLVRTGGDALWGQPAYAEQTTYLSAEAAEELAERRPALVGIDAVNVDDLSDLRRPAHTALLGAEVLVLEHLTRLTMLPTRGARLHAAPPRWQSVGTWPVRAYAVL